MRNRIIHLAIQEVNRKGLKFTMAELARLAGVSTKTLYGYFASKEALITEMIQQGIHEILEEQEAILVRNDLDRTEKVRLLLGLLPSGFGSVYLRVWSDLKRSYPEQWRLIEDFLENEWEHIRRLLEEGMQEGIFRPVNIPLFIHMYVGALEHLIDQEVAEETRVTIADLLDGMIEILLHGIVQSDRGKDANRRSTS